MGYGLVRTSRSLRLVAAYGFCRDGSAAGPPMQQPRRQHPADGSSEMRLPADAGVAGKNAPDQPAVHKQHEQRHRHLCWAPGPDAAGQQVGEPAE